MTATPLPPQAEAWLRKIRQGLSTLGAPERDEIVNELRAHLLDRQAEGKRDVLEGFEPPEDLAASFLEESALRGALAEGSSWALGRALLIAARDSLLGLVVLLPLVLMQAAGLLFCLLSLLKLFMPARIGLWVGGGNFYLGIDNGNPALHEVLGWWVTPVLNALGLLLFWSSNRAMRGLVRWRLRTGKRSRA